MYGALRAIGGAALKAAPALGKGAVNFAGGAMLGTGNLIGKGTMASGIGRAASTGSSIGHALTSTKGPSVMGFPMGKTSAILENAANRVKQLSPTDIADIASYGAFMGAKVVDPVEHPVLHTVLDAAGLAGLAGTTAYGMTRDPHERMPGAKDLMGLALMGSALYDRAKAHGH